MQGNEYEVPDKKRAARPQRSLSQPPDVQPIALNSKDIHLLETPPQAVITGQSFFKDMLAFSNRQRTDKRLTPIAQLLLHTLCIIANRNYWAYPIEVSHDELKELMHVNSNQSIDRAKRQLKNLGYIEFFGKPSKFILYSPMGQGSVQRWDNRSPPHPLIKHTNKQTYQNVISEEGDKNGERARELYDSNADRSDHQPDNRQHTPDLKREAAKLLEELRRCSNSDR